MLTSIVLLAGYSKRMGQPKQHIKLGQFSFLEIIIEKLRQNDYFLNQRIFVGQASDHNAQKTVADAGGMWLSNPNPELGPLSSIRLALESIKTDSAILLWPTDHPMIAATTVSRLIETWKSNQNCITVPSDGNRRGHPTIFPAWCRHDLLNIALEDGARKVLQMHPDKVLHMLTDDVWITKNLNTPSMLEEAEVWLQNQSIR